MIEKGNGSDPTCRPARSAGEVAAAAAARSAVPAADVPRRLQSLVALHLDVDPSRLQPEVRLGEDLCVDSLAAIELTMVIEDEFDISLPEQDVADVRTYGDILALVSARAG